MMKLINEKHEVYILQQNKLNTNKLSKYKDDSSFLLENEIEIIKKDSGHKMVFISHHTLDNSQVLHQLSQSIL